MSTAPPGSRLQSMLQAAVQSVQWTYSLFWQVSPQQGSLVWGDGYYNGAIKTRKTVQPMEVSAEEASLQRSQQLRELYESLSAGETNQPARRPNASLSPEDLTESEWFYLMCVSFSFPPGTGLPGKAYARRQHVWLTGANEIDSKTFSRAILAKSAHIQTVVCIPLLDGVVEFGTTDKVPEDLGFVQHVKGFFTDHHLSKNPPPPKPALSEHSTSNPAMSSDHPLFHSPPLPPVYTSVDPPSANPRGATGEEEDDEDEEEEDEEDDDHESDSEAETGGVNEAAAAQPSELMQLDMSEDIRRGSPDDGSNNLEPDFNVIGTPASDHQRRVNSFRAESARRWNMMQEPLVSSGSLHPPPSSGGGPPGLDELTQLTQEDTHYSQTVSTILQSQLPLRWAATAAEPSSSSSSAAYLPYSTHTAFAKWTSRSDLLYHGPTLPEATSQWLLKYILFSVPYLHTKYHEENSPKSRDVGGADSSSARGFGRAKGGSAPQEELSANHVLAERRRREKLNERFVILRSLVPFVTKMDKASILGDTIEYVKQLRKRIQDLETRNRHVEGEQQPQLSASPSVVDKRKLRIVEGDSGGAKGKAVVEMHQPPPTPPALPPPPQPQMEGSTTSVDVSIIGCDALIELQCVYKEGLLLDVMQMLRDIRIETTAILSSLTNGIFVAELRAKVKDNVAGKKVSIMEVKRAINQIIPRN